MWDNLFGQLGQPIAQVLLTRGDISDVSVPPVRIVLDADRMNWEWDVTLNDGLAILENKIPQCGQYLQGAVDYGSRADRQ